MVGWHHQRNGHEFEQTLGAGDGQGSLASCSPWGHEEEYGVGCNSFLQGIFLIQGWNLCLLCLLHWQVGFYHWCHLGSLGDLCNSVKLEVEHYDVCVRFYL